MIYINSSLLLNAHIQAKFWTKCLLSATAYVWPLTEIHLNIDKAANTIFIYSFIHTFIYLFLYVFIYSPGHK